jgi:hypothetical protein
MIKIEKISNDQIKNLNKRKSKYLVLYNELRTLPMNKTIRVTLDEAVEQFPAVIYQNLRKERTGYKLRVRRQDIEHRVYVITKVKGKK